MHRQNWHTPKEKMSEARDRGCPRTCSGLAQSPEKAPPVLAARCVLSSTRLSPTSASFELDPLLAGDRNQLGF